MLKCTWRGGFMTCGQTSYEHLPPGMDEFDDGAEALCYWHRKVQNRLVESHTVYITTEDLDKA